VFLPNIVLYVSGIIPFISQTWSIGTEEQFYFIWPVLFKKIKNKYLLLSSIIVLYTIIRYTLAHLPANYTVNLLIFFWSAFPIDNMAIGGLFAVMIHDQDKISLTLKSIVFHKATQILTTILLIVSLVWGLIVPYFLFEYYSVLFGIIIVNLAANDRRLINIEFSFLKYLGKISYGLYMYHSLAIAITLSVMIHFNQTSNFILYPVALLLTILLSEISYTYFEQRFIKKKRKFSVVVSGDNVEEK
jgi:peptidoglycan/LPS O-acetylase OafA/YrhL